MKVSGYITDEYGKTDGATIQLFRNGEGTNLAVVSNQDGYFEIDNQDIKPNDEFRIRYIGQKTQIKKASELQDAKIYLSEDIETLDEIVIKTSLDKKPKVITNTSKPKVWENKWYTKPAFLLSIITVVTMGTIVYIIKKTK